MGSFPILVLIGLLGTNVYLYGDDSLGGANQLVLLLTASFAAIIGIINGVPGNRLWKGLAYCFHYSSNYNFIIDRSLAEPGFLAESFLHDLLRITNPNPKYSLLLLVLFALLFL